MNAFYKVPVPKNEPVLNYAPGSKERTELQAKLSELKSQTLDIPMHIGGKDIFTDDKKNIHPPHEIAHLLGTFNYGTKNHVELAINAAQEAKKEWSELAWDQRAAIFLRAAELLAGPYRARINAATMLAQSKNCYQAEIDAACELIDFLKFNVLYLTEIYADQPPENSPAVWNKSEYRPLEGFVFAITPFNFTSIAANLCFAPALMGNTIIWKPAENQIYSAHVLMDLFKEAGVPDGVINMVFVDGPTAGDVIFNHRDFGGLHFTGSTNVFQHLWKTIGNNIANYKSYPRIVGETGGKDFIVAHKSSQAGVVATAITRGAFEFQGQKCSAASRAYVPNNLWPEVKQIIGSQLATMKMGTVEDFSNFINAVIDEKSFDKITTYIINAKNDSNAEVIFGGDFDKSKGYFISPTVILAKTPDYITMCDELFGPVITIYVYDENKFEETLTLVDQTSPYALTGSILSQDRYAIKTALKMLEHSAGNFYINDKPTGAVVGQQPFGGARASGTNDKAGAKGNLMRWVSQRTIKENFLPPSNYEYPFHS
jgi:1-pyrroline-5-carboxylate dehydrogenase